jgi:DNA repair exonuclease SbcCD ATPase subunit
MISLKKLILENFMNVSSATFDFDSKIIIISGKSGAGKSAVIDALALCLSSKKRSSLFSEYVRQGCSHAKVQLDCVINDEPVHFNLQINLIRGTPFQMELTYKGKTYKNTEASEVLKSFDIEYYADIIFSMQSDDFKDITQLSPTQRANYLQRLLNFDFAIEKEKLKKEIDNFTLQLSNINNSINVSNQLKLREEAEKEDAIEIKISELEIESHREKIERDQALITQFQKEQVQINDLNREFNKNSEELNELTKEQNRLENEMSTLVSLSTELQNGDKEIENLESEINNLKKKLKAIVVSIDEEHERLVDLTIKMTTNNEQKKRDSDVKDKLITIKQLYDSKKCPHCGQPTVEFTKIEFDQILEDSSYPKKSQKIDSIENVIMYFEKEVLSASYEISQQNKLKLEIERKTQELNTSKALNESQTAALKTKIITTQKRLDEIEYDPLQLMSVKEELSKVLEKIVKLNLNQEKIKYDLLKFDSYDIQLISEEIVKLTNIINEYESTIKKNDEIKKRNLKRENAISELNKKIEASQKEIGLVTSQLNVYNEAYNILDKTLPNYMVVNTCGKLQEEMNNFIQSVFPNYEVRLSNSKKGCEFFYTKDRTVLENDKRKNNAWINSKMSSGFEKAALTLSFKISLAQLYGLNLLFLDEVEGSADDESAEKLFLYLLSLNFDQFFIISHKNNLKEFLAENFENLKIYVADSGIFELF